jgi:hypothetical protein
MKDSVAFVLRYENTETLWSPSPKLATSSIFSHGAHVECVGCFGAKSFREHVHCHQATLCDRMFWKRLKGFLGWLVGWLAARVWPLLLCVFAKCSMKRLLEQSDMNIGLHVRQSSNFLWSSHWLGSKTSRILMPGIPSFLITCNWHYQFLIPIFFFFFKFGFVRYN